MIFIAIVTLTCKTAQGLFNGVTMYNRVQHFNYSNVYGNIEWKYTCI